MPRKRNVVIKNHFECIRNYVHFNQKLKQCHEFKRFSRHKYDNFFDTLIRFVEPVILFASEIFHLNFANFGLIVCRTVN